MFTGLVEGLGTVSQLNVESVGIKIVVAPPKSLFAATSDKTPQTRPGDSISLNGCCLTVVEASDSLWSFQAGRETLSKTNLGQLAAGDLVNLERSLPVDGRLGGHFVQGHIDGLGSVDMVEQEGEWITMGFHVPASIAEMMVPKGSVAVDGVSLTVVSAEIDRFTVALIPHTITATTLGLRSIGQTVNIETDILGKYARKFLHDIR
ncbi:MAG: riboflavin synthase [Schlesneria sp.]